MVFYYDSSSTYRLIVDVAAQNPNNPGNDNYEVTILCTPPPSPSMTPSISISGTPSITPSPSGRGIDQCITFSNWVIGAGSYSNDLRVTATDVQLHPVGSASPGGNNSQFSDAFGTASLSVGYTGAKLYYELANYNYTNQTGSLRLTVTGLEGQGTILVDTWSLRGLTPAVSGGYITLPSAGNYSVHMEGTWQWASGTTGGVDSSSYARVYVDSACIVASPSPTPTMTPSITPSPSGAPVAYLINNTGYSTSTLACSNAGASLPVWMTAAYPVPEVGGVIYTNDTLTTKYLGTTWHYITRSGVTYAVEMDGAGNIITVQNCTTLPSPSVTPSITSSPSRTPSVTPSRTATPSRTPSVTPSISITPTRTVSSTPSRTATPSRTPSITVTRTPSITPSPTRPIYTYALYYSATSGASACTATETLTNYYSFTSTFQAGMILYTNTNMNTVVANGYYSNVPLGGSSYGTITGGSGVVQSITACPAPTPTPTRTPSVTPSPSGPFTVNLYGKTSDNATFVQFEYSTDGGLNYTAVGAAFASSSCGFRASFTLNAGQSAIVQLVNNADRSPYNCGISSDSTCPAAAGTCSATVNSTTPTRGFTANIAAGPC